MEILFLSIGVGVIVIVLFVLDFRIRKSIEWFSDTLNPIFPKQEVMRSLEAFKKAEQDFNLSREVLLSSKTLCRDSEKIEELRMSRRMYDFKKLKYYAKLEANISVLNGKCMAEAEREYLSKIKHSESEELAIRDMEQEDYLDFESKAMSTNGERNTYFDMWEGE